MSLLAQGDFGSLGLAAGQDTDCQPLHDCHEFTAVERRAIADSLKSESTCKSDEVFRPVNFIPDEVYELIRNWELAHRKRQELKQVVESMDMEASTDSQSSESVLEPMRCVSVVQPPPKRFFRTFWRSVTRRILQLEQRSAMASSEASNDCAGLPGAPY